MPDPELSERLWQRRGSLAFIPITICPETNSKVKCENENPLATEATRSKSELSLTAFPLLFPNQTGHGAKESRTRVKVGNLPITHLSEVRSNYNNSHYCGVCLQCQGLSV
jgi:hypothetical protein